MLSKTSRKRIDLSGVWKCALDPDNVGIEQKWYSPQKRFKSKINVPGTIQGQGFGKKQHLSMKLWADNGFPTDIPWLRSEYSGTAWYKKDLELSRIWKNKQVWLVFLGIHPACEIWVNEFYISEHKGMNFPLRLLMNGKIDFGKENTLTVRIFEKYRHLEGCYKWPIWSGIHGRVYIELTDPIWIDDVFIRTDIDRQKIYLETTIGHSLPTDDISKIELELSCEVYFENDSACLEKIVGKTILDNKSKETVSKSEISFVSQIKPWSPDVPDLYRLKIGLYRKGKKLDEAWERFGFREVKVDGRNLVLNNKPLFIRAAGLMGNYHPLTVAPTENRKYYHKMFLQAKSLGFNYIRCHTYLPTQECLDMADEVGIFIQEEFPMDNRNYNFFVENLSFTEKLWKEMILRDRNHPSIITWCMGNEMIFFSPGIPELAARLYDLAKKIDPTRLVLDCEGSLPSYFNKETTDFHSLAVGGAGYFIDHRKLIEQEIKYAHKPVLIHEFGYGCTFPDIRKKTNYSGGIVPYWLTLIEKKANSQGLRRKLPIFVRNSQKLYELIAKIGIEEIYKVQDVTGYCWWLLKDATHVTTGILDDFCNLKISSFNLFRQFNSEIVLLINTPDDKRCFTAGESVELEILVSNRGAIINKFKDISLLWNLRDGETVIEKGELSLDATPRVGVNKVSKLNLKMPMVKTGRQIEFSVEMVTNSKQICKNRWNLWIFPDSVLSSADAKIFELDPGEDQRFYFRSLSEDYPFIGRISGITDRMDLLILRKDFLDNEILNYLNKGGKIFLMTRCIFPVQESSFQTLWDGVNPTGNMGTIIERHPALKNFPHEGFCNLQFFNLLGGGRCYHWPYPVPVFDLDKWTVRITPIISSIDSYKSCSNRAYMFEINVGKGKLLVTTLELSRLRNLHIEARYLFDQLLRYALSDDFRPKVSVSIYHLKKMCSLKFGSW